MNGPRICTTLDPSRHDTHLNGLFSQLARIDLSTLVAACTDAWYNQTLCQVNGSVVRLGVMQGECHWHKHDSDDEFFLVLDGEFVVDLADRSVTSKSRGGFAVPRGLEHRTGAPQRAGILIEEHAGSIPSGD